MLPAPEDNHSYRQLPVCIITGISEHHSLISCSSDLIIGTKCDVFRLLTDIIDDLIVCGISYIVKDISCNLLNIYNRRGSYLSGDEYLSLASHSLDTGSGILILFHAGLQNSGTDLITNLIRVSSEYDFITVIVHLFLLASYLSIAI